MTSGAPAISTVVLEQGVEPRTLGSKRDDTLMTDDAD